MTTVRYTCRMSHSHVRRRNLPHAILLTFLLAGLAFCQDASASVDLLQGAKWEISREGLMAAPTWQESLTFQMEEHVDLVLRAVFDATNLSAYAALSLEKPLDTKEVKLNDEPIPVPLEGMRYSTIPAIPVSMLREGENTLTVCWKATVKPSTMAADGVPLRLFAQPPSAFAIQSGPILGCADRNAFTVTCRLNMPGQALLKVGNKVYSSKKAKLIHSFTAKQLKPDTEYEYSILALLPERKATLVKTGPHKVKTFPVGDKLVFAALGDSRTFPQDWNRVADAVVRAKPGFTVFVGDMVNEGRVDHQWDKEYFAGPKEYFATIPYYPIIGNHEQNCPLFLEMFKTPNSTKNWSQIIGTVLLIGIDGEMDWSPGSELTRWLEDTLKRSKARFIFLATHYPAWSSGAHGGVNSQGTPHEKGARQARETIMPLLAKYNAAAMIGGHDHFYERSEPENGVTMIITGGAGAPLRDKAGSAAQQNPYSKVFVKKLHYCLFDVDGNTCKMTAYTPAGEAIDTREWLARDPGKTQFR